MDNELIRKCFSFIKANLDEFNEALDENHTEKEIEDCAAQCGVNID